MLFKYSAAVTSLLKFRETPVKLEILMCMQPAYLLHGIPSAFLNVSISLKIMAAHIFTALRKDYWFDAIISAVIQKPYQGRNEKKRNHLRFYLTLFSSTVV